MGSCPQVLACDTITKTLEKKISGQSLDFGLPTRSQVLKGQYLRAYHSGKSTLDTVDLLSRYGSWLISKLQLDCCEKLRENTSGFGTVSHFVIEANRYLYTCLIVGKDYDKTDSWVFGLFLTTPCWRIDNICWTCSLMESILFSSLAIRSCPSSIADFNSFEFSAFFEFILCKTPCHSSVWTSGLLPPSGTSTCNQYAFLSTVVNNSWSTNIFARNISYWLDASSFIRSYESLINAISVFNKTIGINIIESTNNSRSNHFNELSENSPVSKSPNNSMLNIVKRDSTNVL
mmetsp:Transcript_6978/g.10996  ORF Transcript_6978/g.10996 Transcript_6978/m.10996 type:complete len:289 (+) Transcript_6978:150-1016(+)